MSNQESIYRLIGEIKASLRIRLLNAALNGSMIHHCYQTKTEGLLKQAIPNTSLTEEECCTHLEMAAELERRIRTGQNLYASVESMVKDGWLNRLDPEYDDLIDECGE